jgi:hypothetical protein
MTDGHDFAQSLLDAGKGEQPPAGAAERVVEHVAGGGVGMASVPTGGLAAKGAWSVVGVAALAAAAGVAAFVKHAPATHATVSGEPLSATVAPLAPTGPGSTLPALSSPARTVAGRTPTSCERVALPDRDPTVCSTKGNPEALEMVNTCADDVDVFWVDFKCRESFVARVASGQQLGQQTYDTHPWRVRDHATHRLIKEWVGPAQPEPLKEPLAVPDLVIRDGASAADEPPTVCSRPSNPAKIRIVNERTSGVSVVFWVDFDCQERLTWRMEPGETWNEGTFDAHPFRVRDENGKLLVDYLPTGVDQTVYVSLP